MKYWTSALSKSTSNGLNIYLSRSKSTAKSYLKGHSHQKIPPFFWTDQKAYIL